MQSYITLVKSILNDGVTKIDRTRVGTKSVFNANLSFDLRKSFTKKRNKMWSLLLKN
jgi:thymidylate synthase